MREPLQLHRRLHVVRVRHHLHQQQYPSANATYQEILNCEQAHCPICSQSGVGDSCVSCESGLTCPGLWCTRACAKSTDCTGIGQNGGNLTRNQNACLHSASGDLCVPGCSGDLDCTSFPNTYCQLTTDVTGASVQVCAPTSG